MGEKPLSLMRTLVRDYSRPDDLVCDPFAGSGTTLLAAAMEGRSAIGAEMDPKTYELAVRRLSKGYTERLFREGLAGEQQTAGPIAEFEAEEKRKRKEET
jgi:DNA modification methylase